MADIMIADISGWRCVQGTHPFPSRTRWLRPDRPMVLHWRRCGRAGGRQIIKSLIWKKWIDLYQWSEIKKDFGFWWLINISQSHKAFLWKWRMVKIMNYFFKSVKWRGSCEATSNAWAPLREMPLASHSEDYWYLENFIQRLIKDFLSRHPRK